MKTKTLRNDTALSSPPPAHPMDRRSFLRLSALAGGGLMIGLYARGATALAAGADTTTAPGPDFTPSIYIRITSGNDVTLVAPNPEMGQGVKTSLPMMIAEELDLDFDKLHVEQADLNPKFYARQVSGGSTSTPNNYEPLRRVGAAARAVLVAAAAKTWSVSAADCVTARGAVTHTPSNRTLTYGQLAATAATLPVPDLDAVKLKDPRDFKLLGTRVTGVDNKDIVAGRPLFGLDVRLPGMKFAAIVKSPVLDGKVKTADLDAVKKLPGVRDAFILEPKGADDGVLSSVAIVADSTWQAFSARDKLNVTWDNSAAFHQSTDGFAKRAAGIGWKNGDTILRNDGDYAGALASAAKVVEAAYAYPFIAHATLEPQNCTALFKDGRMELWAPTQNPGAGATNVATVTGLPPESITVHVMRSGGGFGRRLVGDAMAEVAAIAQHMPGVPVHLTWNRSDDFLHDFYRPGGFHFLRAGLDAKGRVTAWRNHFVTYGYNSTQTTAGGANIASDEFPGRFLPNYHLEQSILPMTIPTGALRAPGANAIAWVVNSFIDELAHAAGRDPVELNLEILGDPRVVPTTTVFNSFPYDTGRMAGVLKVAAEKSGWSAKHGKLPRGQGIGVGLHFCHQGYCAHVAEVTVSSDGKLKVNKVTTAVDVGQIVNLNGAENQIQGAVMDALGAAWWQEMPFVADRPQIESYGNYQLLTMRDVPDVDIYYAPPTGQKTTGLGEPAYPPLVPAVCNAIFDATGIRVRTLPISKTKLAWT